MQFETRIAGLGGRQALMLGYRLRLVTPADVSRLQVAAKPITSAGRDVAGLVPVFEAWLEVPLTRTWRAAYRLHLQGGIAVVSELRVFPNEHTGDRRPADHPPGVWSAEFLGADAQVPRGGLTSRLLRRVKIRAHLPAVSEILGRVQQYTGHAVVTDVPSIRRWGRVGPADERLAAVASEYVKLIGRGSTQPVSAIAKATRTPVGRVYQWLYRARQRGLLTRPPRGIPGGRLTARGERLADAFKRRRLAQSGTGGLQQLATKGETGGLDRLRTHKNTKSRPQSAVVGSHRQQLREA